MSSRHPLGSRLAHRRKGVSLVEMLVVLFIIAMLTTMVFVMTSTGTRMVARIESDAAAAGGTFSTSQPRTEQARTLGDRFLVVFQDSVQDPKAEAERICAGESLEIFYEYHNSLKGLSVKASVAALAALQQDPTVQYVQQEKIVYASAQTTPTGVRRMSVNVKPGVSFGGTPGSSPAFDNAVIRNLGPVGSSSPGQGGVNVAVVDSGVDSKHPDLNVVFKKAYGLTTPEDVDGHGTHVAGIIAARNNSIGVVGVCPGARIWNFRVLGDKGTGSTSDIIAALDDIALLADRIHVVNMSLGSSLDKATNAAVDKLVKLGIVVCVAAGNSTVDAKDTSPASASLAICVAALSDSDGRAGGRGKKLSGGDADDTFASYSNFGKTVAVIAPGTDILSTIPGGGYDFKSGTSMATPYVAGIVGLMRAPRASSPSSSQPPTRIGNLIPINGSPLVSVPTVFVPPTPAQVRQILINRSTESIPGLSSNSDTLKYPLVNASGL